MKKIRQFTNYQKRQSINREVKANTLGRFHFDFISKYLSKNKNRFIAFIFLIISQIIIEVSVIMFASGSIRDRAYSAFHNGYLGILILVLMMGGSIYMFISYKSLKLERQIVIGFINIIRRLWYSIILNRSKNSMNNRMKADFLAKISYHFPLLSLGIDNSFIGFIRSLLLSIVLIVLGIIGGLKTTLLVISLIVSSLLIILIAYMIANYFISQEVASYSQVIRNIANNLSEFDIIKDYRNEFHALKEMDARVNTDTYFRIRRDIWLRYFNKILYTLVFIVSFLVIILGIYFPDIFYSFYNNQNPLLFGLISLYTLRLIYECGKTGLYLPPLRLGIILSIPENTNISIYERKKKDWISLEFRSNKVKILAEGSYYKRVSLKFERGYNYLFMARPYLGKTSLAEIISGNAHYGWSAWLVKIDNKRYMYKNWRKYNTGSYYIHPKFNSDMSVGDIIFNKPKYKITSDDLNIIYGIAEKNETIARLVSKNRFIGESIKSFEGNMELLFSIHVLYCLVQKPNLIIIDNQWIDLNYKAINDLISLISKELRETAFIIFSRNNNDIIPYNHKYEINKESIEEI